MNEFLLEEVLAVAIAFDGVGLGSGPAIMRTSTVSGGHSYHGQPLSNAGESSYAGFHRVSVGTRPRKKYTRTREDKLTSKLGYRD